VLAVSGGFLSITVEKYFHWNVPWGIFSVIITAGAVMTMIRGVGLSTKLAGLFFGFEMLILIVVSIAALIKNGGHLSLTPFEPSHVSGGLKGFAAGFPLAIYSFIGWENSASLAEETNNPRRNVPRAVFLSVSLMAVGYVLFAYATVSGFNYNVDKLGAAQIPFITVADNVLSAFAVLAYIAGLTSTVGVLISAANSQARLVFNAGREGLLPAWIGRVHPKRRTPMNAIYLYISVASSIIIVWGLWHLLSGRSGSMDPITFFVESSTMGTILVLVVYALANLALPVYFRKYRPDEFDVVKHGVLPLLGVVAIAVPMYYLAKPGQDAPYSWFPWIGLVIVILAIIYSAVLVKRDPSIGDRVGSLLADD
jgi:amino acid transporter